MPKKFNKRSTIPMMTLKRKMEKNNSKTNKTKLPKATIKAIKSTLSMPKIKATISIKTIWSLVPPKNSPSSSITKLLAANTQ